MQTINNFCGYWKFSENVNNQDLQSLANELRKDKRYLQFYIRLGNKNQHSLGFEYKPEIGADKEEFNKYMDDTTDFLKKKFGNSLVGWDVSSSYTIV